MAARGPDLQLGETNPLLADWDPNYVGVPILHRGFHCFTLPRQPPQSFVDPGHCKTHVGVKIRPGGLNSKLEVENSPPNLLISRVPTLIIGMGVSHPPGYPNRPSIAVVIHSRAWPVMSEYRAFLCTKPPKVDMIDSLYKPVLGDDGETKDVGIMREVLQDFEESTGMRNPEHIIIFRYGVSVSESHLIRALEAELDQISEACKFFDNEWSPKFAVIRFLVLDDLEHPRHLFDDICCVPRLMIL